MRRVGMWTLALVASAGLTLGCESEGAGSSGPDATTGAGGADTAGSEDGAGAPDAPGAGSPDVPVAGPDAPDPPLSGVTYHKDIRPLIEAKCVGCHSEGGIGPFALDGWAAVDPLKMVVSAVVESGQMPPWTPAEDCRDLQHSRALSDEAVAAFVAWRAEGFPEGDPADYVAPDTPPDPRATLGEADLQLTPAAPYTASSSVNDDYHCLPIDHTFDATSYIKATDIVPGDRGVVHHVLVYTVPPEAVADLEARDAADPGVGYTCYGGPGVQTSGLIAGWVPGMQVNQYPPGAAFEIEAGSRIVMQIHYNTVSFDAAVPSDLTALHLWTLPAEDWSHELKMRGYSFPGIQIPAGDPEVVQETTLLLSWQGQVIGAAPHMHLLGTATRMELLGGGGDDQCLIDIPSWDFNWQQIYHFEPEAFVDVSLADEVRLTCQYDNSPANQPTIDGQKIDPIDVTWGEGTLDEMCITYLILMRPVDAGICAGVEPCLRDCPADDVGCAGACLAASGATCTACAADGVLGACAGSVCPTEFADLSACVAACPGSQLECAFGECVAETTAVWSCVDAPMLEGACDADLAGCDLSFSD